MPADITVAKARTSSQRSDDEVEQIEPDRKRRRLGDKQYRYQLVASKFPQSLFEGQTLESELEATKMPWESVTKGVQPTRLETTAWSVKQPRPSALQLTDLECVRLLGDGAIGDVCVVKTRKRKRAHALDMKGEQMAIKRYHKRRFREQDPANANDFPNRLYDEKNSERGNLHALPWHPFIAGMYDCLADSRNLYILQELGHCGTLGDVISRHGPLPTSVCRFYFANLVLALEFLRSIKWVHLDVKPDNILVGADGYLMLADFGSSGPWREERWWAEVGSLQYFSPEWAQRKTRLNMIMALDWWSAGCILYEMATGRELFPVKKDVCGKSDSKTRQEELRDRVMRGQYVWPQDVAVDSVLKDLVDRMLVYDEPERFGARVVKYKGRVINKDMRRHPFFKGFVWQDVADRVLLAPYTPKTTPDFSLGWHYHQLPRQRKMPGLPRVDPPEHLAFDRRFRTQKDMAWQQRERERLDEERERKFAKDKQAHA